ncbi:MAG: recombinase family protein, partial [Planctomycetes bacterium]|nr:recombinase family protein [Planctomycetota bacterium]
GAQLARELADLALYLRDDQLAEGARRALRLVIDEPPEALLEAEGWESVREFLDEHLEQLLEDGENGEIAVHRLTRPYLQGLRTHAMTGARLRALGESMSALLSLYDEQMGLTAREWLFEGLERLAADGLPPGGHARRLMRTAAKSVGRFYKDGEVTPALELTQALARAGVAVFPEDDETMRRCPDPSATFHRLETSYDEKAPRFQVMGAFEPAATTRRDAEEAGVTETGAITVSLGPEPRLLTLLAGPALGDSRLSGATARLATEAQRLDGERLRAELAGDAGAERTFAEGLAGLFCSALAEGHWRRGEDSRAGLGELFSCLSEDYHLELLPGFLTYRRLRELQEAYADQIKVEVVRDGPREVTLRSIGAVYRDELLRPLDMTWGVGEPPPYVAVLREALDWVAQVLDGKTPRIALSPAATEAIKDFESPDAGSVEGVVRSLGVIVTWLANEVPAELEAFGKAVKNAPGLEFDFFPLPGQTYTSERILQAVEQASSPDGLTVVRDAAREDGQAVVVEQIAMLKDGRLIGEEPRARFSFKTLPQACESLDKALQPVLKSAQVARTVKAQLSGHLTRLALLPPGGDGEKAAQLGAFRTLLQARLIDPSYSDSPESKLHEAGAHLASRLSEAGLLKIERFEGKRSVSEALEGYSADDAEVEEVFAIAGSAELAEVRRPLAKLEGVTIQKGALMKAIPTGEADVLEFDGVLVDTLDRLRGWIDGAGSLIEDELNSTQRQVLPRTVKRISDVRRKMFENQAASKPVLPPDTARRDLIRFVIDQVHRAEDTLAIQEDKSYRNTFGDAVFKEVVFRSAGPFLSNKYGISIDTSVVAGADTQALVGKFKKEATGPKPKVVNAKVYSVVVPCYMQEGVTIRPATIRVGVY